MEICIAVIHVTILGNIAISTSRCCNKYLIKFVLALINAWFVTGYCTWSVKKRMEVCILFYSRHKARNFEGQDQSIR